MRLLTVANDLVPYGGLERMQLEIHQHLAARGHVNLLIHGREGSLTGAWEDVTEKRRRVVSTLVAPRHPHRAARTLAAIDRFVAETRPDVIHLHHYRHLHVTTQAARRHGVPVLLHLHSVAPSSLGPVGRRLLRRTDRVVAVSDHTGLGWRRWRTDVGVVHNGVDLELFEPPDGDARARARAELGLEPDAFVVGFAGRLTPSKGVPQLLDSWRRLGWSASEAQLAVAGPDESGLLTPPVPPGVVVAGFLDDPRPLYAAADVLTIPSTWPDPCPRAALEAMACGRAVVASHIGGLPELVTAAEGVLVQAGDHDALVAALQMLRDDPARVRQLGEAGRRRAETRFGLGGCVDEIEAHLFALKGALDR